MRIPGAKTLRQTGRWLATRGRRTSIILGYHRIAEADFDPFGLCVSPKNFSEHLEVICQQGQPSKLVDMVQQVKAGELAGRTIAITLDDGYSDALFAAIPLLEKHNVPATCFVVSGYLGRTFWWDELQYGLEAGVLDTADSRQGMSDNQQVPADAGGIQLYHRLLRLDSQQRESELRPLRANLNLASKLAGTALPRMLSEVELVELGRDELVEIGAHSDTHPRLADLAEADQKIEICRSREVLSEIVGRPVTAFSYPNGSVSPLTRELVVGAGFACACASHSDLVSDRSDPMLLPRFWVPDWDGDTFARWLKRWL